MVSLVFLTQLTGAGPMSSSFLPPAQLILRSGPGITHGEMESWGQRAFAAEKVGGRDRAAEWPGGGCIGGGEGSLQTLSPLCPLPPPAPAWNFVSVHQLFTADTDR